MISLKDIFIPKKKLKWGKYDPNRKVNSNFERVCNTLESNRIMVITKSDGIYIRFAGNLEDNEIFCKDFIKVCEVSG